MKFIFILSLMTLEGCASLSFFPSDEISRDESIYSYNQNPLSLHVLDTSSVGSLAQKKDPFPYFVAQRIMKASYEKLLMLAQKAAQSEMDNQALSEEVFYELALANLDRNNIALARFYVEPLLHAASGKVRSSSLNLLGILSAREDRIPDAIYFFNQSLANDSSFSAARINLGLMKVRCGDWQGAEEDLSKVDDDPLAQLGLLVSYRHQGKDDEAQKMCDTLLGTEKKPKIALFNCALFFAQKSNKDPKKAKAFFKESIQSSGPHPWDEKAKNWIHSI